MRLSLRYSGSTDPSLTLRGRAGELSSPASHLCPRSAMAFRSPRSLTGAAAHDASPLAYEIAQQKALTLGRVGARFARALEVLREFDESARGTHGDGRGPAAGAVSSAGNRRARDPESGKSPAAREELVADAAEALWCYVIQREVCGFQGVEWILREYDVPREVHLRMGPRTAR